MQAASGTWDVIDLTLVNSFAASVVGVGAASENYLYTREASEAFLSRTDDMYVLEKSDCAVDL